MTFQLVNVVVHIKGAGRGKRPMRFQVWMPSPIWTV